MARDDDARAENRASRDARLRDDEAARPDDDVVADLDQIVDFRALLDPCAAEARAVNGRVGTDFDIVVDLDDTDLRDLLMSFGS